MTAIRLACLAALLPMAAAAAEPAPASSDLEARIQRLEQNAEALREQAAAALAEAQAARAELQRLQQASTQPAAPPTTSAASSANAFNPAITLILDGQYGHHSLSGDAYQRAGFPLVGEGEPGGSGLSLGESELSFAANVDDRFFGQLTLAAESEDGEDSIGIEEAFLETLELGHGFTARFGRFFSNIGYLNNHHAHTDNFSDRPLAYQAFLGGQLGDDGVQLRWVAPSEVYLELGGELLRGQNFPAGGADNDIGSYSLFAHAGGDVGFEHAWLAGLSMLQSESQLAEDGFVGDSRLYLADLTWKWAPQGNFKSSGLTLRSEFFFEDRDGVAPALDAADQFLPWLGHRRGSYLEGVYQLGSRWQAGYRYDRLWATGRGPFASDFDPFRHGVMVAWRNSEFSLLRLQLSRDRPDHGLTDNSISLQYQAALGAHGAHKF